MNKELKENIMQGTLQAFNQKGLKFTMDDIAKILGISKKTIYQVFRDKEALFLETVDYLFDRIKDSEQKIVENQEMDTLQKIHTILGVMPECYQDVDFRQLYQLKEKYPEIYHQAVRFLIVDAASLIFQLVKPLFHQLHDLFCLCRIVLFHSFHIFFIFHLCQIHTLHRICHIKRNLWVKIV